MRLKKSKSYSILLNVLFCFEWTPYQKKESEYPIIKDFALCLGLALLVMPPSRLILGTEHTFLLFGQGQILTLRLLGIKPGARLDTRQPGAPQHIE